MKHIHILGICGTFMGSLALLAKARGYTVTGSDENIYPPMSTLLNNQDICIQQGYSPEHLTSTPDMFIIGNAMSRGNPSVEHVLNQRLPYTSGPQFLSEHLLHDKWVLAVAGTHGKTTTASMLAWILERAGMQPGFLIGGIPVNFGVSARPGETPFFIIEADEYDTAFFDKRSKFIHYQSRTVLLNNLEFDHADIFDDIKDIQKQFHHLVKTLPSDGLIISPDNDPLLGEVLSMGCWTPVTWMGKQSEWHIDPVEKDGSHFHILHKGQQAGTVKWTHTGRHNSDNALGAVLAARHAGVAPAIACEALCEFKGIKRRMELLADINGVCIYDDFAHHPTAITKTLEGWRQHRGDKTRIRVVIEPRSNTMKQGVHQHTLAESLKQASEVIWLEPQGLKWSLQDMVNTTTVPSTIFHATDDIITYLADTSEHGDDIIIMSNGGFNGLHQTLINVLQAQAVIS